MLLFQTIRKMKKETIFRLDSEWIVKLLAWAEQEFSYFAYFNPNGIAYPHDGFEHLFFAGDKPLSFSEIDHNDYDEKVGILGYDLKNQFERLQSTNPALMSSPDSLFFAPRFKIKFKNNKAEILHPNPEKIFNAIQSYPPKTPPTPSLTLRSLTTKEEYIENVQKIKNHIIEGDIYEMNYCIAYEAVFDDLDPIQVYSKLTKSSPMPFSVLFKAKNQYIVGASPERFLKRSGSKIIAQPIKGTVRRGDNPEMDQMLRHLLANSEKEKAENLMIVDLMRSDLARVSNVGSVTVEELFGIYPFKTISQMISTVSAVPRRSATFKEIIENTFPMGSMTGAPKIRCMELIDKYENFKRGWFSGAVGYISSQEDFDFNVVIRSIILDKEEKRLFFAVGSAITFDAIAEQEYEECLLKARPIFEALSGSMAVTLA